MIVDGEWVGLFVVTRNNSKPQTVFLGNLRELRNRAQCVGTDPFKARVGFAGHISDTDPEPQNSLGYLHVGPLTIPGEAYYNALPSSLRVSARTHWLHTQVSILQAWTSANYNNRPELQDLFKVKAAAMAVNLTNPEFSAAFRLTETLDD
jgi:hypothetical protein